MKFLRPLLGLALLVGLLSLTDPLALLATFKQTDLKIFGIALVLAIVANLICVYRWQVIAGELGIQATYGFLLSAYAQGMSANSVLPGGIVGGDAWRSLTIARKAPQNSKRQGVLSVLMDRVSGFWGLTWLSLLAGLVFTLLSAPLSRLDSTKPSPGGMGSALWFESALGKVYLFSLIVIVLAPLLGRLIHLSWLYRFESEHHNQRVGKWAVTIIQIINALPILKRTLLISVVIQVLTATSFWLCLKGAGVVISWWLLTALCGGVFLSSILPAALGGFGARELGAVAFITPFGFSKEGVLAGSVLFGLTATFQGVLGLWFWFKAHQMAVPPKMPRY